ncbi:MAG: hypothetical protein ACRDZW_11220 [Acidimicrobiales bacterium]
MATNQILATTFRYVARIDLCQTAGPQAGACGDAGVSCVASRRVTNTYNLDATLASTTATDEAPSACDLGRLSTQACLTGRPGQERR